MAKILLVEDDKSLREIYGIRLVAEGYEIFSAGDGEEALAVAVREKPDLILSDVMMPKISGFDMLDIIRSTPETKDIKVIMMTALSAEDQRQRGESLGADKYLVKSQVGIEDVVNAIHEVMGDRVMASEPVAPAPQITQPVEQEINAADPATTIPEETAMPIVATEATAMVEPEIANEAKTVAEAGVATEAMAAVMEPTEAVKTTENLPTNNSAVPEIESGAMDIAQMIGETEEPEIIPVPDQQSAEHSTQNQPQNNTDDSEAKNSEPQKSTGNVFAQPEEEIEITASDINTDRDPNESARLRKMLDDEIAKMESAGVVEPAKAEAEIKTEPEVKPVETAAQDQNAA